jgi:hypothetical protein
MKTIEEKDIILEIHQIRESMAARFNYDIKALFDDTIERQKIHGIRLVAPRKKNG